MRALRKVHPRAGLVLDEHAPTPDVGADQVLVAVEQAGVCGTDRHIYEWDAWASDRVSMGTIIGHEFSGRIAACGRDVTRVRVGQRVSGEGHIGCGTCQPCRTGQMHICDSVDIIGIDRDGCFSEFVALPQSNVWPVPDSVSDHEAALMDPLGNAVHTVATAGVAGRTVLVTGAGVIGLLAIQVARAFGAGSIIAADVSRARLQLALKLGADAVLDATDVAWPEEARRLTSGQGPEVLLEISGSPSAIRDGFRALRNGGTAALLGLPADPVPLDLPNGIIFKGAKVIGVNGRRMYETWYQSESLLVSDRIDVSPIISHVLPLECFDEAFGHLAAGNGLKVLLEIGAGHAA